jgi:hypothetical protein
MEASNLDYGPSQEMRNRAARRRTWLWFALGFSIVFFGLSATVRMKALTPSGDGVIICKLWKYYIIEIQRAVHAGNLLGPTTLGPTNGCASAALTMAFEHFLFSCAGGIGMLGIRWIFNKLKGRPDQT